MLRGVRPRTAGARVHCTRLEPQEIVMAGKNKGGRETRKPKQEQNKKHKGQTPAPTSPSLDVINAAGRPPKK
jgi:hypothetical protein